MENNVETREDIKRPVYLQNLIDARQEIGITEHNLNFTIAKAEMEKKILEVSEQIGKKEVELNRQENAIPIYPEQCYETYCEVELLKRKLSYIEKLHQAKFIVND